VVRQAHLIALVVVTFLIGCTSLPLGVGCAGTRSETSNKKEEQGSSPKPTASKEEAKCEGTRRINVNLPARFTTNDLPGCPKGGLLLGTDKADNLAGEKGDDEIRGLGGSDGVMAGRATIRMPSAAGAMTSSTADQATITCRAGAATTSSTADQATIQGWTEVGLGGPTMGTGTRSIAVKAGTHIGLRRSTMWTAVARRSYRTRRAVLSSLRREEFLRRSIAWSAERPSSVFPPSENAVKANFGGCGL
jgi:hypothetical protein